MRSIAQIHLVKTNDIPAIGQIFSALGLFVRENEEWDNQDAWGQHLHFLSTDDILENDWFISTIDDKIMKSPMKVIRGTGHLQKIVATTDKSLGLPLIPKAFLDYYVGMPNVTEVEITGWYDEIANGVPVRYMHIPLTDPLDTEYTPSMKDKVETLLANMPVSETRVPYTYHHDYLRSEVAKYEGMSRSEVAQATTNRSEDELYAFCFLGAVRDMDEFGILFFDTAELRELFYNVTKEAREILREFTTSA